MTKAQGHGVFTPSSLISGAGGYHVGSFGRPRILMNQHDPKGGAGGGTGGSGAGAGGPGDGGGGDEDGFNEAQRKAIGDMVNQAVTGAVTNHLGRFKKQFTEDMGKTLADTLNPISEQLKALSEVKTTPPDKKGAQDEAARAVELRYESRIKELETANKAEREAREAEKQTRLREEERSKLAQVLRDRGIPDPQVRAAVALIHTEDKKVGRAEDGRVVFKVERGTGQAKYVDELDIDKGVDEWLKTDEGKAYIPPRQAAGAGGQPARGTGGGSPGDKRAQATQDLAKILLGGGVG